MVHLADHRAPAGAALCGATPTGRMTSRPEKKNEGVVCSVCLRIYQERRILGGKRHAPAVRGGLLARLRMRYGVAYYADGAWQSIGRTWWTRRGATRAARRVLRNAARCRAARVVPRAALVRPPLVRRSEAVS